MIIIGLALALVVFVLSARFLASFYVDYLWHESVGRTDVFWGILRSKLALFAIFGGTFMALAAVNLVIADRLAPSSFAANTHPLVERFHEFFGHRLRLVRFATAAVLGVLFALPTMARWQDWKLFRNSTSFGINDPRFGNDVGFYMFKLPFVTYVVDWLFLALIIITLLVLVTHVLSGGIVLQQPRPKFRRATKAHLAVLLALLALVKAGDYWVTRYELTTANRGAVRGITYAVDNAQLPAVLLLALVAVLVAALYLSTLKTDKWRPAVVASALWAVVALVAGVIYPSAIQSLVVKPNQKDKEAEYIAYNIEATRHALGLDDVQVETSEFGQLNRSEVSANVEALRDVRFIRPDEVMENLFRNQQGQPGQSIVDLDPDRYEVDGEMRQIIVGARELDLTQVGNTSWQGTHLISTHGCGLAVSLAGQITATGSPVYRDDVLDVERPQLYFSPSLSGYAVVGTNAEEPACEGAEGGYEGDAGVQLDGTFRQLAVAIAEFDYNLIGSSAITDSSRFVSVRNVRDRVAKVAPFLSLEADPYAVVVDGRVLWVIDGYTTSNRYPYAESGDTSQLAPGAGLDHSFNYVRNSVKATVDAYDGSVVLYAADDTDPVLKVWSAAFPDLFTPAAEMPAGLVDHLRYPEELFTVQTWAYSKYRLDNPDFFSRNGAWSVAEAPKNTGAITTGGTTTDEDGTESSSADAASADFAVEEPAARFVPYYAMFHSAGDEESQFVLVRPFQPFSKKNARKELTGYMTATLEGGVPHLVVYEVPGVPPGSYTVGADMLVDPRVSADITAFDQRGSKVSFGDLQMLPVADGLLWMMPMYVESEGAGVPQIQRIMVWADNRVGYGETFSEALTDLYPGLSAELNDVGGATDPDQPDDPDPEQEPGADLTAQELLEQADELFADADAALAEGDFATYDEKMDAARELVQQALDLLNG